MSLSQNHQEIKTNKQLLGGIMKGVGFLTASDAGKPAGVYARKAGLSPHQIDLDNIQWTKLQNYEEFIYSRISHFSQLAARQNQSLRGQPNYQTSVSSNGLLPIPRKNSNHLPMSLSPKMDFE
ncbi:hypothetical protein O181_087584 [Austropuccinia psidii MF-1]|uniref:Uncharacterized protein n=1 Tax=Austropuccinia psidii MF-1 TaxID=1389203 RepID=A0A9Q3IQ25_9BASI|nr:hypothetical protein [Austropuccinia psidii MF-1]